MKFLITERQYRLLKEQVKTTDGFLKMDPDYELDGYVGIHDPSGGAILVPEGTQVNLYTDNTHPDDFPTFKKWRNTNWEWWIPNKQQLKFMTGLHWGRGPTVSKFKQPNGEMYRAVFANEYFTDEYAKPRPDAWKFEGYFDKNGKPYQVPKSPKPLIDHEVKIVLITIGAIVGTILCPECWLGIAIAAGTLEVAEEIRHGDLGDAGIAAAFTLLSFVPWSKMFKFKGKVDLDVLQKKLIDKAELTDDEMRFLDELKNDPEYLNQLKLASDNLNFPTVTEAVKLYKKDYISKFGQESYDNLVRGLAQNKITKNDFITNLKKSTDNTQDLASFSVNTGVKFTAEELNKINEITDRLLKSEKEEFFDVNLSVNGQPRTVTVSLDPDGIDGMYGGYIPFLNQLYFNVKDLKKDFSIFKIKEIVSHEIAHLKDPGLAKRSEAFLLKQGSQEAKLRNLWSQNQTIKKEILDLEAKLKEMKPGSSEYINLEKEIQLYKERKTKMSAEYDVEYNKYATTRDEYVARESQVFTTLTDYVNLAIRSSRKDEVLKLLDEIETSLKKFSPINKPSDEIKKILGEEYIDFYQRWLVGKPNLQKKFHQNMVKQVQNLRQQIKLF